MQSFNLNLNVFLLKMYSVAHTKYAYFFIDSNKRNFHCSPTNVEPCNAFLFFSVLSFFVSSWKNDVLMYIDRVFNLVFNFNNFIIPMFYYWKMSEFRRSVTR